MRDAEGAIAMIKSALAKVVAGEHLTNDEAYEALQVIMSGEATEAQIGGFLVGLLMKGETAEEIAGFARAMRDNSVRVPTTRQNLVDTVGTGGDRLDTFNISTAAAFVAAGAGVPVAKHGNRCVTSTCGSADVLTELGVDIAMPPEQVGRCIDEIGIGFLFAPALHPAMKHAVGPRKELALRTVFNILGPLTNPAGATRQVVGVYAPNVAETMAYALRDLGSERALVVHGMVGLDEISTIGETLVVELRDGHVSTCTLTPADFCVAEATEVDLFGGPPADCAAALLEVLEGGAGPRRDIVLVNAGATIYVAGLSEDILEGMDLAARSIDSGAAKGKLEGLKAVGW
jgi:anthranilate phosphoribosyltransferase